ncbi:MAG: hypothetical protein LBB51_02520, partial [Zoogloeaceae bacterium]|nr:hypothetical protein [Zoogloeaceae bacterium]
LRVPVRRGCFALDNSTGAGALTLADVGKSCYIADDSSVTKTATGKSVAGTVRDVDADGVWVAF